MYLQGNIQDVADPAVFCIIVAVLIDGIRKNDLT